MRVEALGNHEHEVVLGAGHGDVEQAALLLDLLDVAFQSTLDSQGADAAYKLVKDELRRSQTLLGLDKMLEAQVLVTPTEGRHDLELVRNLVHSYTRRLARYRCENCGFKARQFYWHCPACGGWETYPPRRSEEFDQAP